MISARDCKKSQFKSDPTRIDSDEAMPDTPKKISTATAATTPMRTETIATAPIKDSSAKLLAWRRLGIE